MVLCVASLAFGLSQPGHAANTTTSNIDRYGADYFMAFEPQTLYDILENTPGANSLLIAMSGTLQSRGFGSAGDQILINNKRVSGKENSLDKELTNIQARDVDYIELIRGTRSDLDVQSEGLVVNVVLKKQIEPSLLWSVGGVKSSDLETRALGAVTFSSGEGDVKYRLGLERHVNPTKLTIVNRYTSTERVPTDTYTRVRDNFYMEDRLTGKVEYQYSEQTALQANGLFEKIYVDADYTTIHDDWLAMTQDRNNIIYDWQRDRWEFSGDIIHEPNENNRLKLLFISNKLDANDQLNQVLLTDDQQTEPSYRLPRLYIAKENVLRGNWKHDLDKRHSFDTGLELAINSHDESLQFIRQSGDTYQSTELNDIEETRYEAFVNYNFAASSSFNVQSSLIYERSTLEVDTEFSLVTETTDNARNQSTRSFSYLKPRLNLRYDIDDIYQLRFNLVRTVSQLNLDDFVPKFNREETRLEETNPDLKPEVRDQLSVSIEKQWQSTDGSLTLTPYYHKISDLITEIPLTEYSGDGNIDSGKEYGLILDSNFGLEALGLDNTLISASYTWRDSEASHPFTQQNGPIERLSDNKWSIQINQKELLPGLAVNLTLKYGGSYPFSRYDYRGTLKNEVTANAVADYQINRHLKLRLKAGNLLKRKSGYDRIRHTGIYTETEVKRREQGSYQRAPRYSLTLMGQF